MSESDRSFFGMMFLILLCASGGSTVVHPFLPLLFLVFAFFILIFIVVSFVIDKVKSWFRAKDFPEQHPHW